MVARWKWWAIKAIVLGLLGGASWEVGRMAVAIAAPELTPAINTIEHALGHAAKAPEACSAPKQ